MINLLAIKTIIKRSGRYIVVYMISILFNVNVSLCATNSWQSVGPYGARVTNLVVNPQDPSILYGNTNDPGGVIKSYDGGNSWVIMDLKIGDLGETHITIDPLNPSTLYLTGGRRGVYKSIDSGLTWFAINYGLTDVSYPMLYIPAKKIVIDPKNSDILYLTSDVGVFKSINGGGYWLKFFYSDVRELAIDPNATNTIYLGTHLYGVYKSMDGGLLWFPARNGLLDPNNLEYYLSILQIQIDPKNSSTLYVGTASRSIYKSLDGGLNWFILDNGLPEPQRFSAVSALSIDPHNSSNLFAAMQGGLFKSNNGGAEWVKLNSKLYDLNINAIAFDPTIPDTLYAGSSCIGVSKSTDAGNSWSFSNTGLNNLNTTSLVIDPINPSTLYVGTACIGVMKSSDRGDSWVFAGNGLINPTDSSEYAYIKSLSIDPHSPDTLYAGTREFGLYKSENGGLTWVTSNSGFGASQSVTAVDIDPINASIIYAQTESVQPSSPPVIMKKTSTYKSIDRSFSWFLLSTEEWWYPYVFQRKRPLAIDPINPTTLYLGAGSRITKSNDGGAKWFSIFNGVSGTYIIDLAIDKKKSSTLFMGTGKGVYKSLDGGANWFVVHPEATMVGSIAIDHSNSNKVYIGSAGGGIERSENGGISWVPFNEGLINQYINEVILDPSNPRILYAASEAGVYRYEYEFLANDDSSNNSTCFIQSLLPKFISNRLF